MTSPIQFNNKLCTKTVKIYNVMIDALLPLKTNWVIF